MYTFMHGPLPVYHAPSNYYFLLLNPFKLLWTTLRTIGLHSKLYIPIYNFFIDPHSDAPENKNITRGQGNGYSQ